MGGLWFVLIWLASLLLGTYLGYERGRWETGLILGGLFGPLGALAAGLLTPSPECEALWRHQVGKQLHRIQREEAEMIRLQRAEALRKRQEAHRLEEMVEEVEEQFEVQRNPLAEGLEKLAGKLDQVARKTPADELAIRSWIGWLGRKSQSIRDNSEDAEEPPAIFATETGRGRPRNPTFAVV